MYYVVSVYIKADVIYENSKLYMSVIKMCFYFCRLTSWSPCDLCISPDRWKICVFSKCEVTPVTLC